MLYLNAKSKKQILTLNLVCKQTTQQQITKQLTFSDIALSTLGFHALREVF